MQCCRRPKQMPLRRQIQTTLAHSSNRWRQDISESTSFRSSRRDRTLSESIRSMNSSRRRTRDRIKAFLFSRPMSEKSVKKVVARIKRREELRRDAALGKPAVSPTASPNVLRSSDDTFPSAKRRIEWFAFDFSLSFWVAMPVTHFPIISIFTSCVREQYR
uniref:Uncharacterized protein n=1 Tax=Parascaris univalens TaxID=6257 RepID=A0A914ZXB3_PARUN